MAITKEVTTLINDTYITADTLVAFLKSLGEKYSDGKAIAIVLDNARYQHCFVVKAMAATLGIHLLFLPPYSPNLNIIERLWKFTKKKKQILHMAGIATSRLLFIRLYASSSLTSMNSTKSN